MSGTGCPFCEPAAERLFHQGPLVLGLWDRFPVSPGHALLVPRRHVASWFDASHAERVALVDAIARARRAIEREHRPDGYNLGVNVGEAAGQTVFHLHLHVIPRYAGDVAEPRGGVRHVIPARADYVRMAREARRRPYLAGVPRPGTPAGQALPPPHWRPLVCGEDDPLLPHLRAHVAEAVAVDLAVAFVLARGLGELHPHLEDLVRRGGRLRVLTGDYLDVTEPDALQRLLDLDALAAATGGTVELRVFESQGRSFHPKAYITRRDGDDGGVAFVGSSNLSHAALGDGVEWNYRVIPARDRAGFAAVVAAFDALFAHPRTRPLDAAWVEAYRARRPAERLRSVAVAPEPLPPPAPHPIQREALAALERTRAEGNAAGLVVLATGLGKTWLAALDSARPEYRRVLFVAHREEILGQALATFRRVRPSARLGLYTGQEQTPDADVLLASVQTLGRSRHLSGFAPDAFDYIVVDEFHHAAAATYRRLIDHFRPRFLLGLTATPERADGGDLLALCGENLVYRRDFADGIRAGLLVPFRYFGVPDEVDYRNIPWRSTRFDEEALTRAVATRSRARNALEQHRTRAGRRTLAFCCSTRHADFMAAFFAGEGLRAAAVHSGPSSAPRAASLERLEAGELDVVFAVDMFNEGVDLPHVDTVMMLRPTESRVLWLQQFGRGLRTAEGKTHLTVVDYIGNHRTFLIKPQTLLGLPAGDARLAQALEQVVAGRAELPPGCEVTYELEAIDILRGLLRPDRAGPEALRLWYEDFRERQGVRPRAVEALHEGYAPRGARPAYGSWLRFVAGMGDLDARAAALVQGVGAAGAPGPDAARFLDELEITPMTRSYKMVVLLAMLGEDCLPGSIAIEALAEAVTRLAQRSAMLRADFGPALDRPAALRRHLESQPIAAWCGGAGTSGVAYFEYDGVRFACRVDVPAPQRAAFQELAGELVDWRLAEYLMRPGDGGDRIVCQVGVSSGRPVLILPDRGLRPDLPEGVTPVLVDGQAREAVFDERAVAVLRRPGSDRNELPALLRAWFGADAGLPGTDLHAAFERDAEGACRLAPLERPGRQAGPEPWRQYPREQIPPLFGLAYSQARWNQGFVDLGDRIVLLVTLDKSARPAGHRYRDRFLAPDRFEWQSQNRQRRAGKAGQRMARHVALGIAVHLFVRRTSKVGGRPAPFVYCGECEFEDWQGDRPITVRWRLRQPVPDRWRPALDVPAAPGAGA